jgi:hypothetical protein
VRSRVLTSVLVSVLLVPACALAGLRPLALSSPASRPGAVVTVAGRVPAACRAGRVQLVSAALAGATRQLYFGKPAVSARIGRAGSYKVRLHTTRSLRSGSYAVIAVCGGTQVGSAILAVR